MTLARISGVDTTRSDKKTAQFTEEKPIKVIEDRYLVIFNIVIFVIVCIAGNAYLGN